MPDIIGDTFEPKILLTLNCDRWSVGFGILVGHIKALGICQVSQYVLNDVVLRREI